METTVLQIAELLGENVEIWVYREETDEKLGHYDGRDSIPEECNDLIIKEITILWWQRQVILMV